MGRCEGVCLLGIASRLDWGRVHPRCVFGKSLCEGDQEFDTSVVKLLHELAQVCDGTESLAIRSAKCRGEFHFVSCQ